MVEGKLDSIGSVILRHFALGVTSILPPDLDYLETDIAHCVAIECFCEVTTSGKHEGYLWCLHLRELHL
jgi:hypothetical protein